MLCICLWVKYKTDESNRTCFTICVFYVIVEAGPACRRWHVFKRNEMVEKSDVCVTVNNAPLSQRLDFVNCTVYVPSLRLLP